MMVAKVVSAEAGRAEEQDVIECLTAGARGLKRDGELGLGLLLADELGETRGRRG